MKSAILLILFSLVISSAIAKDRLVVAKDGTGDFQTVQAAIDAVPDGNRQQIVIFIKKGIYKEKITVPLTKSHIVMIGENRDETILTNDNYASKPDAHGDNYGTSGSSSFFENGNDFIAANLTFENSSGPVGQAVAMRVTGTRVIFNNCRFLGFQDTLYTQAPGSRQYYQDCYIEGTVDYIFGASTVWFENCTLHCKRGGGSVTAASTPDTSKYGYIFHNCKITGDSNPHSFSLGRPWRPNAKTVFLYCTMDDVITGSGWNNWGKKDNEQTTFYAEYNNNGPGASLANRVAWSKQLSTAGAESITVKNVFEKDYGWNPETAFKSSSVITK